MPMKITHRNPSASSASGAPSPAYVRFAQRAEPVVAKAQVGSEPDQLDRLMSRLAARNPSFADRLKAAGQKMAALVLTADDQETLLSLRMKAGLTQAQFAAAIGQKQSNVSLMESGMRVNPQRKTMHAMCAALGCSIEVLDAALTASEEQHDEYACALSPAERAIEEQKRRRA